MATRIPAPKLYDSLKHLDKLSDIVAVDTETVDGRPFAVGFHDDQGAAVVVEWNVDPVSRIPLIPREDKRKLLRFFKTERTWVMHNKQFDVTAFLRIGVDITFLLYRGQPESPVDSYGYINDTMVASHTFNSQKPHDLKSLGLIHLNILDDDEDELKKAVNSARRRVRSKAFVKQGVKVVTGDKPYQDYWLPKFVDPESTLLRDYLIRDIQRTILLWLLYSDWMMNQAQNEDYEQAEVVYTRKLHNTSVAFFMTEDGVPVRPRVLKSLNEELKEIAQGHVQECMKIAKKLGFPDFNINSPAQLGTLLFDTLGLPVIAYTAGGKNSDPQPSTKHDHLVELFNDVDKRNKNAVAFLEHLLGFRAYSKGITYLDEYWESAREDGRVHFHFNTTGTGTTRWSSSNPNAQNVSKKAKLPLRKVFGPKRDKIWFAIDYSQLELRIFAVAADSKSMKKAFAEGADIHSAVAQGMFGVPADQVTSEQRRDAKAINFGIIYGMGEALGTAKVGDSYYKYKEQFPEVGQFSKEVMAFVRKHGYVSTLGGYHLTVDKSQAYAGVDYICQGTAGDIIERALSDIDIHFQKENYPSRPRVLMQVHDELVFEFHRHGFEMSQIEAVARIMQEAGQKLLTPVYTPVEVKRIDSSWFDGHAISVAA